MISPAQSQARQSISGLSRMYKALTMVQKGLWQQTANQVNASANRTGRHKMTPANAFSMVNSARITAYLPIVSEPVLPLTGPPVLPAFRLEAGSSSGAFSLQLLTFGGLDCQICVQAAPPVAAGKTTYSTWAFKPIGAVSGQPNTSDITALYTAKYGVPEVGAAIAVRLYAVSPAGLRGGDLLITTVYLPAAAVGAGNGEQGLADEGALNGEYTLPLAA